jgi:hypothetical protein
MIATLVAALLSLLAAGHIDSGHPLPGSVGIGSGHPLPGGAPAIPDKPLGT